MSGAAGDARVTAQDDKNELRCGKCTRQECVRPMHTQFVRGAPGAIPICGMALELRSSL